MKKINKYVLGGISTVFAGTTSMLVNANEINRANQVYTIDEDDVIFDDIPTDDNQDNTLYTFSDMITKLNNHIELYEKNFKWFICCRWRKFK